MNYKDYSTGKSVVIESGHTPVSDYNSYRMGSSEILPGVALGLMIKYRLQDEIKPGEVFSVFYGDDYNRIITGDFHSEYGCPPTVNSAELVQIINPQFVMYQSQMVYPSSLMFRYLKNAKKTKEKKEWNKVTISYENGNRQDVELVHINIEKKKKQQIYGNPRYSCPLMTTAWTAYKTGVLSQIIDFITSELNIRRTEADDYSYGFSAQTNSTYTSVTVLPKDLESVERVSNALLQEFGIHNVNNIGVYFDPQNFLWFDQSLEKGRLPKDFDYNGAIQKILQGLEEGLYSDTFYPSLDEIVKQIKFHDQT